MFGNKKQQEDEIKPSKGVMKWINKFFRFILYPFIHPWVFLFLILFAAAAVLVPWQIYKVELADIPQWYAKIFTVGYKKTSGWIEPLKTQAVDKYNDITGNAVNKAEDAQNKEADDMIDYTVESQVERPVFQEEPVSDVQPEENIEGNAGEDNIVEQIPSFQPEIKSDSMQETAMKNNVKLNYMREKNSGLNYLDVPQKIDGRFTVINANDILVGSNEIMLYGIETYDQKKNDAREYLLVNVDRKNIECYIVAYNAAHKAMAICFDGEMNINQEMVDKGYSKSINLY